MTTHTLTITVDAEITDEAALIESVQSDTPEGSLSPDDIREEDRAASTLVAGVSKALKALAVPGSRSTSPRSSRATSDPCATGRDATRRARTCRSGGTRVTFV